MPAVLQLTLWAKILLLLVSFHSLFLLGPPFWALAPETRGGFFYGEKMAVEKMSFPLWMRLRSRYWHSDDAACLRNDLNSAGWGGIKFYSFCQCSGMHVWQTLWYQYICLRTRVYGLMARCDPGEVRFSLRFLPYNVTGVVLFFLCIKAM